MARPGPKRGAIPAAIAMGARMVAVGARMVAPATIMAATFAITSIIASMTPIGSLCSCVWPAATQRKIKIR